MTITHVSLAATPGPTFSDFWNPVSEIYARGFNITPSLAFIGTPTELENARLSEEYGKIHRFDPVAGVSPHWAATWAIFFQTTLLPPESVCLTIGIDEILTSRKWLKDLEDISEEAYFTAYYNTNGWDWRTNPKTNISTALHVGTASKFKEIYQFSDTWEEEILKIDNVSGLYIQWADSCEPGACKWGLDEAYSTYMLRKYKGHIVNRERWTWQNTGKNRVSRMHIVDWTIDEQKFRDEHFLEAHLPRPYEYYKIQNDRFFDLLRETVI